MRPTRAPKGGSPIRLVDGEKAVGPQGANRCSLAPHGATRSREKHQLFGLRFGFKSPLSHFAKRREFPTGCSIRRAVVLRLHRVQPSCSSERPSSRSGLHAAITDPRQMTALHTGVKVSARVASPRLQRRPFQAEASRATTRTRSLREIANFAGVLLLSKLRGRERCLVEERGLVPDECLAQLRRECAARGQVVRSRPAATTSRTETRVRLRSG